MDTRAFRYDLAALAQAVKAQRGRTMAVVAYAGDSRTQTVDRLRAVAETVREHDSDVWLHLDACWGLMCALTPRLTHLLDGLELFDSVTVDPHKVLNVPYGISALLLPRDGPRRTSTVQTPSSSPAGSGSSTKTWTMARTTRLAWYSRLRDPYPRRNCGLDRQNGLRWLLTLDHILARQLGIHAAKTPDRPCQGPERVRNSPTPPTVRMGGRQAPPIIDR
ncbi:pyridoxal-dependent decarboxylase [Kitasatospora sp. NPDC001175]|uniref:pyridoxal-dependent decarboxylase n=1 Tax=Kitasatospora sp. NPDC001175 TaxID=3157103 RepID=UPI003D0457A7